MFIASIGMFMFLLLLIDLFINLARYLANEVPFSQIMLISLHFVPQSLYFALPVSLLFASAYTLGDLYARNELTSVFASGIPYWRFGLSLIILGTVASVFSFFFNDLVVIPTMRIKNEMTRHALRQHVTASYSDIVIRARNGEIIYAVDFFDSFAQTLNGVQIVETNSQGEFISLVRSRMATWSGEHWEFVDPVIYFWEDGWLRIGSLPSTMIFNEHPDIFWRSSVRAEDLPFSEVRFLIQDLRAAGMPYTEVQADFYHRVSFSAVTLIVVVLSISMGGRFRKNIMLMSLLSSVGSAVVFYVIQMITMMMARLGHIPPAAGGWFPVTVFIILGFSLLVKAKT